MKKTILAIACGMAFTPLAQAEADNAYVLDEVVVTASRTPMAIADLISDVTVIRSEEIRNAGAVSLTQLLQNQVGIEITAQGGLGSQSGLFIRGANANHTLVLVDGMRINSATVGLTALEHIPLSQIERIEILRGSASSLYGTDAIGGVVQIFTRANRSGPGLNLEGGAGSFGTHSLTGGYTYTDDRNRLSFFLGQTASDGFDATSTSINPDDDGYRNNHASVSLEHFLNPDNSLQLNGFLANGRTEFDASPNTEDVQKQQISSLAITSRNKLTNIWESTLRLGQSQDDLRNLSYGTQFETIQRQFQWQNDVRLPLGGLLIALERTEQDISGTTDYTVTERDTDSGLVGYQLNHGSHTWQLNARHDKDSQFGGHTTGSAAYGYRFNDAWRLSTALGSAFKAPTFNDLYYPYEDYGAWGSFVGNPDLKPERATNMEIGVRYEQQGHAFTATYFQNRIKDLIAYDSNPPTYDATMINVNRAEIQGLSLQVRSLIGPWRVESSLDLQAPEDSNTGNLLPRRARKHGTLLIMRSMGNWDARGQIIASDYRYDDLNNTRKLDSYMLLNLGLDYRLDKSTRISARLNNVFNEQYELAGGYNTPDRNFFIGLRYQPL